MVISIWNIICAEFPSDRVKLVLLGLSRFNTVLIVRVPLLTDSINHRIALFLS